jgi:collagenase-like PrtC family protease
MKLSVATNWDPKLISSIRKFNVSNLYGTLNHTIIGGGRASSDIPSVSKDLVESHIKEAHKNKINFTWLLNASCTANREFSRPNYKNLIEHLEWLKSIKIDTITIANPFLLDLIKEQFPSFQTKISIFAHVDSLSKAKIFEDAGADIITIYQNRNFELLKQLTECLKKSKIELYANNACATECPYAIFHANALSHASSNEDHKKEYIDYCTLKCTIDKAKDPSLILKSGWIRPEDISVYEKLGLNLFKLSGRQLSTEENIKLIEAYSERSYNGNLLDLIHTPLPLGQADINLDNNALKNVINIFKNGQCQRDCYSCKVSSKCIDALTFNKSKLNKHLIFLEITKTLIDNGKFFKIYKSKHSNQVKTLNINKNIHTFFESLALFLDDCSEQRISKIKERIATFARLRNSAMISETDVLYGFYHPDNYDELEWVFEFIKGLGINIDKLNEEYSLL